MNWIVGAAFAAVISFLMMRSGFIKSMDLEHASVSAIGLLLFCLGVTCLSTWKWRQKWQAVFTACLTMLGIGIFFEWYKGSCNLLLGCGLFLLMSLPSMVLGLSLGDCSRKLFRKTAWRCIFAVAVILISLTYTGMRLYSGSQVFSFNPFFGYFPGPIFDRLFDVDTRFVLHRGYVMVLGGWWFVLGLLVSNRKSRVNMTTLGILSALIVAVWFNEQTLGFYHGKNFIKNRLSGYLQSDAVELIFDKRLEGTGSFTAEKFMADCEFWLDEIKAVTGLGHIGKITVFVYHDASQKKYLMGAGHTLIGNPIRREVHLLPIKFPNTILKHELTHVVASEFGVPLLRTGKSFALTEGLAVALEGGQGRWGVDVWARAFFDLGNDDDDAKAILVKGGFLSYSQVRSYSVAGSFIKHLIDEFGIDPFRKLYRTGNFEKAYGREFDELFTGWKRKLTNVDISQEIREKLAPYFADQGFFATQCVRQRARLIRDARKAKKAGDREQFLSLLYCVYEKSGPSPLVIDSIMYEHLQRGYNESQLFKFAALAGHLGGSREAASRVLAVIYLKHGEPWLAMHRLTQWLKKDFSWQAWVTCRLIEAGEFNMAAEFLMQENSKGRRKVIASLIDAGKATEDITMWWLLYSSPDENKGAKRWAEEVLSFKTPQIVNDVVRIRDLRIIQQLWLNGNFTEAGLVASRYENDREIDLWLKRLAWHSQVN